MLSLTLIPRVQFQEKEQTRVNDRADSYMHLYATDPTHGHQ